MIRCHASWSSDYILGLSMLKGELWVGIFGEYICLGLFGLRNCWGNPHSKQKRDFGWNWLYIHVIMTQWSRGGYILYECMLDTNKHCQWVNGWFCVPFDNMPQVISYNYDIEKAVTSGWYSFWLVWTNQGDNDYFFMNRIKYVLSYNLMIFLEIRYFCWSKKC